MSVTAERTGASLLVTIDRTNESLVALARETGRRVEGIAVEPDHVGLERLAALVDAGKLRVHVSTALRLDEASRAHTMLTQRGRAGKIVLAV